MVSKGIYLRIAVGLSCRDTNWLNKVVSWDEFCARCRKVVRTPETLEAYFALPKEQQGKIKDKGGFVGGELSDGHRKASHVMNRYLLVYDLDDATPEYVAKLQELVSYQGLFYSTHKHRPEKPRIRLVLPLQRPLTMDEFAAVSRLVAHELGIMAMVDVCSFQPHQMMYWPTAAKDGEFLFGVIDKPWLTPDEVLARYPNWRDFSTLPHLPDEKVIKSFHQGKAMDPRQKFGLQGAFNRCFDIHSAIETFLEGVYIPTTKEDRYTYSKGECAAGLVVYDHGMYAYSHHHHDPICGRLCDAYNLVRLHLYGHLGEKKSNQAMQDMVRQLPEIKLDLQQNLGTKNLKNNHQVNAAAAEKSPAADNSVSTAAAEKSPAADNSVSTAAAEKSPAAAEDWKQALEYNNRGRLKDTMLNLEYILANDPVLKNIVYNEHADMIEVRGEVPWKHNVRCWRDRADDAQLKSYLAKHYGEFSRKHYEDAFLKVADDRSYHPIREYFARLPEWDGVPRVDRLFVEYLGAEDNAYIHAVTRKTLCGGIMRVLRPGCKFDYMVVLNGIQGAGKSTLISKLGGPWFSDSLLMSDTRDKTAAEKLQGYWILEIGELAGMNKTDVETLRSFLTRQNDIFRAAFGARAKEHPRQCIFIGTTNAYDGYLRDTTGNRRFWPVKISGKGSKNSWDLQQPEIDQIWAEAMVYAKAGEPLYLSKEINELAQQEQRAAMEADDRIGLVEQFLQVLLTEDWKDMDLVQRINFLRDDMAEKKGAVSRTEVCTYELWCECLGNRKSEMRRTDSNQLVAILTKLGWERVAKRNFKIYGNQVVYKKIARD